MKRTTITRLVLISMFTLAILGCNLAETIGGGDAEAEPTAPAVVYVTATPRPTLPPTDAPTATPTATMTPEPEGLTLQPCANYPEDCPAAISATRFYEVAAPFEYTFDVPSEIQLFISTGWGAIDMATLEQNMPYVDFFLEIDGEDYFSDLYTSVVEEPDPDVPSRMNGIIYLNVVLTGWVPQVPHTITIGYTTTAPLNDGWEDYETGFEVRRVLHVCPDGNCPSTGLNFTPCTKVQDCPDAVQFYQYIDYTKFEIGKEYSITVPFDKPLHLLTGAYVKDPAYFSNILPNTDFFFEVDGQDCLEDLFIAEDSMQDFLYPDKTITGYAIGVVIQGWEANIPHRVRFGYIHTSDFFDGDQTWPAGSSMEMLLLVNPVDK